MTDEEKKEWLELCEYFKVQILGYSKEMKFPKMLALRLRGLHSGNYIESKYITKEAKYDFKTILITCKICRPQIVKYFSDNQTKIKDESHKVNIAMMIIEKELNDVYLRVQQAKKSEDKIKEKDMSNQLNDRANYQPKTKKVNEKLKDLW
jgi:hypothetical protein